MTELYQLYYEESQRQKLLPFAIPVKTEGLTIFFENYWIVKLVLESTAEKVGVCSWKLAEKMRMRVGLRQPVTQDVINSEYEVLSFTKNSKKHSMLAMANAWHPEFIKTITLLWEKLGYKMKGETKQPVYQNHHISKREIYKDYVLNFLLPAMELIKSYEELNKMMIQPSGYSRLNRHCDIRSVKSKLGMDEYPLCPFIMERCPSLWFDMKGIKVAYL